MTVFRFAPYVLKSLWRNRTRTALTVSGSALAIFVFCFVGAVREGLAGLNRDRQSERTLVVFQANRFCPFTSHIPEDYARTVARMAGVRDVVPIQEFMNNCRASLDVVVFLGIPPGKVRSARALQLVSGDWNEFERRQDAALVGRALVRRRNLAVGRKFSIGDVTVQIAGVYSAAEPAEENFAYTHLDFLQRTKGLNAVGTVTQMEVLLKEDADPGAVAQGIDDHFRSGQIQTDTRPKSVFQANAVADLADLIGFTQYLGFACVGLVLALVATTTVMAVQDRVREHAVLQTLGFSGPRIFRLVLTESLLVSLAGGLLGVGAGLVALTWSRLAVGTEGVTIAFTPSASLAGTGMIVVVGVGVLAGLVPAWQAARAEIVASLRYV